MCDETARKPSPQLEDTPPAHAETGMDESEEPRHDAGSRAAQPVDTYLKLLRSLARF